MEFDPALRLGDIFQGGIPQFTVWCDRVIERDARLEGKILEDGRGSLHIETLCSCCKVVRKDEREDDEALITNAKEFQHVLSSLDRKGCDTNCRTHVKLCHKLTLLIICPPMPSLTAYRMVELSLVDRMKRSSKTPARVPKIVLEFAPN